MSTILEKYKWKHRLLILFTPDQKNELYQKQLAEFEGNIEGFVERDLELLKISPDSEFDSGEISDLYSILNTNHEDFSILLIGKDGLVKMRSNQPIEIQAIFDLIDEMPMRKEEMRKKLEDNH